jgi:hypothetical protein
MANKVIQLIKKGKHMRWVGNSVLRFSHWAIHVHSSHFFMLQISQKFEIILVITAVA